MSVEFLVRLRGKATSPYYEVLAGKSWDVMGNGNNPTSTENGVFGGYTVTFGTSSRYLRLLNVNLLQSHTISFWAKVRTLPPTNSEYSNIMTVTSDGSTRILAGENLMYASNILRDSVGVTQAYIENVDGTEWHHYGIVYNYDNNIQYEFLDGILLGIYDPMHAPSSTAQIWLGTSANMSHRITILDIDDFCIINGCLWTKDFTPPTDYLELPKKIFLSAGAAYGIDTSGSFTKLTDDFAALTDTEKLEMMNNVKVETQPAIAQLETLAMPIKAVDFKVWEEKPACILTACPKQGETITPKGRINLAKYSKLKAVNITGATSGNGTLKVAVTKDNETYQVWDVANSKWETINIANIPTDGMSISEVAAITPAGWETLDCLNSGIGFAYYLSLKSTDDKAYTDELSLSVELVGELKSLVQGRDYDYSYVSNNILQVKLYKDGNFRINYYAGQPSTMLKIPTVNLVLVFNDTKQTPTFSYYDPDKMQISGELDGTDAGTRTVAFTPINGYKWEDMTTTAKNVTWSIAKAESNLSVSNTNISLSVGDSITVTADYFGDGILGVAPSEGNVTAVVNGKDIIITGETVGTDSLGVIVTDSINYNGGVVTVSVTVT